MGICRPIKVLCLGDSLTAGTVAGEPRWEKFCYVSVLQTILGPRYNVVNAGRGGTSAMDWVNPPVEGMPVVFGGAYEQAASPNMPCHTAIACLGGNEAVGFWEKEPAAAEVYRDAMVHLVDRLLEDGAKRVFVLTPIPNPSGIMAVTGRLLSYRLTLIGHKWPKNVHCVDIYQVLDVVEDFIGSNPHPNKAGHRKIANAVARAVRLRGHALVRPWLGRIVAMGG